MNFYWIIRGHYSEGRDWLERALHQSDQATVSLRTPAMIAAGWLAGYQGDYDAAATLLTDAIRLEQAEDDTQNTARALLGLGQAELERGAYQQAAALTEEAIALFLVLEATSVTRLQFLNRAYTNMGRIPFAQGDFGRAATALEEALRRARTRLCLGPWRYTPVPGRPCPRAREP